MFNPTTNPQLWGKINLTNRTSPIWIPTKHAGLGITRPKADFITLAMYIHSPRTFLMKFWQPEGKSTTCTWRENLRVAEQKPIEMLTIESHARPKNSSSSNIFSKIFTSLRCSFPPTKKGIVSAMSKKGKTGTLSWKKCTFHVGHIPRWNLWPIVNKPLHHFLKSREFIQHSWLQYQGPHKAVLISLSCGLGVGQSNPDRKQWRQNIFHLVRSTMMPRGLLPGKS